ncbi:hypothetical protein D3C79_884970 [compost metagenome]
MVVVNALALRLTVCAVGDFFKAYVVLCRIVTACLALQFTPNGALQAIEQGAPFAAIRADGDDPGAVACLYPLLFGFRQGLAICLLRGVFIGIPGIGSAGQQAVSCVIGVVSHRCWPAQFVLIRLG